MLFVKTVQHLIFKKIKNLGCIIYGNLSFYLKRYLKIEICTTKKSWNSTKLIFWTTKSIKIEILTILLYNLWSIFLSLIYLFNPVCLLISQSGKCKAPETESTNYQFYIGWRRKSNDIGITITFMYFFYMVQGK